MKKVVTFGEIMLRLVPGGFLRFSQATSFDVVYGGKLMGDNASGRLAR